MSLVKRRPHPGRRRRRASSYYITHMLVEQRKIFSKIYRPAGNGPSVEDVIRRFRRDSIFTNKPKVPSITPRTRYGGDVAIKRETYEDSYDYQYADDDFTDDDNNDDLSKQTQILRHAVDDSYSKIPRESEDTNENRNISAADDTQPEAEDAQSDVGEKPESGTHDDMRSAKNGETTSVAKETDEPAKPYDRLVVEHSNDVIDGSDDDDDDCVTSRVNTPESSHYEDTDDEERQQEMNELEIAAPETDAKDNAPEKDDDSGFLDVCVLRSHYGGYVKEEENDSKEDDDADGEDDERNESEANTTDLEEVGHMVERERSNVQQKPTIKPTFDFRGQDSLIPKDLPQALSKRFNDDDVRRMLECTRLIEVVKKDIETNAKRIAAYEELVAQSEKYYNNLRRTQGCCQLIWKISNFRQKVEDAKANRKRIHYSPAFETHPYGYKLAVSLVPNGDGQGKGKYMSVFFTIMKGKWDGILSWPFKYPLTFTLLDQSETDTVHDVTATFTPRPDERSRMFLDRPEQLRNPSLGLPKFACWKEISRDGDSKYIKDDCIFIKISIDVQSEHYTGYVITNDTKITPKPPDPPKRKTKKISFEDVEAASKENIV